MLVIRKDNTSEVFEIDLVNDSGIRRDNAEIAESLLPPSKKRIPFLIPGKFQKGILGERTIRAECINLHGMIDYQVGRY